MSKQSAHEGGKVVSLTHRPTLPSPGNIPGTHFCLTPSQPQRHSANGRIMSIENSDGTIGNRTRDIPTCSSLPQTTAPPRDPGIYLRSIHFIFVIVRIPSLINRNLRLSDLIFLMGQTTYRNS